MKTRKALVDSLIKNFPAGETKENGARSVADALINEGFVQVQEPREFWLYKAPVGKPMAYENLEELEAFRPYNEKNEVEIIHVREVVE